MKNVTKSIALILLCLCLFPMFANTSSAAEGIKITVEEGIDGKVKEERGFPITVTVQNGAEHFKGDIVFDYAQSFESGGGRVLSIDLPPGETRTFSLTIPGFGDPLRGNTSKETIHLFKGDWKSGKEVKFTGDKRLNPNFIYMDYASIGLLSKDADRLKSLKASQVYGNKVEALNLSEKNFPGDATGLQMFDFIVIDGFDLSLFSKKQLDALHRWVDKGGTVLIGSDVNVQKALGPLADIAPLKVDGEQTLSDLSFLETQKNLKVNVKTLSAIEGELTPESEAVIGEKENPILAKKSIGRGEVWQASFLLSDSQLNDWAGFTPWINEFYSKTKYSNNSYNMGGRAQGFYYEMGMVNELFPSNQFKVSTLILVVAVYLILVIPVLYFLLRKFDKREQSWWIIPTVSILLSIGIFLTGAKDRVTKPHMNQMSILEADGKGAVQGISAFTFFSNSSGDYTLSAGHDLELYANNSMNAPEFDQYKYSLDEVTRNTTDTTLRDVEYWSTRTVMGDAYKSDAGSFSPQLSLKDKTLTGSIGNDFPYDFEEVYLWSGTRTYSLGGVKAGQSLEVDKKVSVDYLSSPVSNNSIPPSFTGQQGLDDQRKQSLEQVSSYLMEEEASGNRPVIFGYTKDGIVDVTMKDRKPKKDNLSLVYQSIPSMGDFNGPFSLKNEQLDVEVKPIDGKVIDNYSMNGSGEMELEDGTYEMILKLPEQMQESDISLNSLSIRQYPETPLEFSMIAPSDGKEKKLEEQSSNTFEVKDRLTDYLNEDGEMVIKFVKSTQGNSYTQLPKIVLKGEAKQ
ncbi:DUF7408 domain-containing protein [Rossellomorea marisflavi]|uniref:DUF7408 domain-containing protein n=1 Tax=Rossellomorea marisflavi TaxID=189381 RepID=UPI00207A111C|nr:hypothetical protein [Rossellomorea marisflavi]USK93920.1 hypothetical protein LIT29_09355 [Rossellomorea marisflavi]